LQYCSPYFQCLTNAERAIFSYIDLYLVINVDWKCRLQCVNYFFFHRTKVYFLIRFQNFKISD
jgi:hypothetical protein